MAGQYLWPAEIALFGNGVQDIAAESFLGRDCHEVELVAVKAKSGDRVRHDEMGLGINGALDIVSDDSAVPRAGGHDTGIRAGQGNLAGGRLGQGLVLRLQPFDLLPDASIAPGEARHLLGPRLTFLLPVDANILQMQRSTSAPRWARWLEILPMVKFLSRLFTALNFLPSMATQSPVSGLSAPQLPCTTGRSRTDTSGAEGPRGFPSRLRRVVPVSENESRRAA